MQYLGSVTHRMVRSVEVDTVPALREVDVGTDTLFARLFGKVEGVTREARGTVVSGVSLSEATEGRGPRLGILDVDITIAAEWVTNDHTEAL